MLESADVSVHVAHAIPLRVDRSENVLAVPNYVAIRELPTLEVVAISIFEVLDFNPHVPFEMRTDSIQKNHTIISVLMCVVLRHPCERCVLEN